MSVTPVTIINHGLSLLSETRISSINPADTRLELYMSENYPLWRDQELSARRWNFALEKVDLTETVPPLEGEDRPHRFLIPSDVMRPVQEKPSEWVSRGGYLFSATPGTLRVMCIKRVSEDLFDPYFVKVLACRIAADSCEYVTQSNVKKEFAERQYANAVATAGMLNSYVKGSEDRTDDLDPDTGYTFLTARQFGGLGQ